MKKLHIEASTDKLNEVIDAANEMLEEAECPMKVQIQIDVALEEMFVNIAHYAYEETDIPENERYADIGMEILDEGGSRRIRITLEDRGIPYDPLAKEDPDITLSVEERKIGGLGIFMVKKSMDHVSYEYRDGKNCFTMEKIY